MSDALEKLQHDLEVAQRALAEAEARCTRQEAEHQSAIKEAENIRKQIEQAHQEWTSVLDAVEDPIFVHDMDYRVLRCNLTYQQHAGIPFKQIIGQPYYAIFPKTHVPLPNCRRAMESAISAMLDVRLILKNGIRQYHLTANTIKSKSGLNIIGMGFDITERKRAEADLAEQLEELRRWYDVMLGREERILELKHEVNALLGQTGQSPRYSSAESPNPKKE